MFAAEICRVMEATARVRLPAVTAVMWKAFGDEQITEAEALGTLIEARRSTRVVTNRAEPSANDSRTPKELVGSQPRTDASLSAPVGGLLPVTSRPRSPTSSPEATLPLRGGDHPGGEARVMHPTLGERQASVPRAPLALLQPSP